jgi:F-type H+-transporting ATPase subunit delta
MAHSRVASRYVKSLLSLAEEQKVLDQVHADMQLLDSVCKSSRDFSLMLKSPIIRHDKKRDILEAIFKNKVHKITMAIIDILTKKNREPLLPEIAAEFHHAYNVYKGIQKATITTTVAMDHATRTEIEAIVKKLSDKTQVEVVQKVDSSLIGGFVLNVGDKQIDASIKTKLKTLQVKFSENPYIKEF